MDSVSSNDGFVEGQARLRAIPQNEFINRVLITALRLEGSQAGEYGCFGLLEIGKSSLILSRAAFRLLVFLMSSRLPTAGHETVRAAANLGETVEGGTAWWAVEVTTLRRP